ncbi:hypothetical protein COLO4_26265 [Corchorus olitorius]|uniref:Uncharacterized protein n=1 Tax=Corchorus olitorius TaxID=93759 RepID=A0A1R3HXU8_9ROSI|nr:hypothetical protein COLO4_26265 [Corchorus olitorius]
MAVDRRGSKLVRVDWQAAHQQQLDELKERPREMGFRGEI